MKDYITIIGGGLAGSEAAYQIAKRGIKVKLYEMKPDKFTEAHSNKNLAEIVCSNSFKSNLHTNACGLLKEELRKLDSLLIRIADETQIPAGQALAVDRELFSQKVTEELEKNPLIEIIHQEVTEIEKIAEKGIKEIVITGIHIASYGKDFDNNYRLIDLLEDLDKIDGIERIRLGSLEPTIVTKEFAERLSKLDSICNQFHLSLQSGCDETLKRMNRKYTKEQYLALVEKMKARIPGIVLSTDIIVGFPGETEEDFEDTLDVVSKVHFEQVYMFIYSRRVGTPADKMENQVPDEVKHERFDRLKKLAESQIAGNNQKYVNTIQKVLVEGKSKTNENMLTGRTETNKVVNFEGTDDMIGKIVNLKIVSEHMWYLKGEV